MPISITCSGCLTDFNLADSLAGKQVKCSTCAMVLQVPPLSEEEASARPADTRPLAAAPDAIQEGPRPLAPAAAASLPSGPLPPAGAPELPARRHTGLRTPPNLRPRPRMPAFVWLVPVLFAVLFLVLGCIGAVIMHGNHSRNNNFRFQRKFAAVAPPPPKAWGKKEVVIQEMPVAKRPDPNIPAVFQVLGEPVEAGITVQGSLQPGDPVDALRGNNCFCKVYQVRLAAACTYTIDMRRDRPDFDPYLRLVDGNNTNLRQDDDGGGMRDARIVFTPEATGDFRIVATSLVQGTGTFRLSVQAGPMKKQDAVKAKPNAGPIVDKAKGSAPKDGLLADKKGDAPKAKDGPLVDKKNELTPKDGPIPDKKQNKP